MSQESSSEVVAASASSNTTPIDASAPPTPTPTTSTKSPGDPLLQSIKQFVSLTNSTLASFEKSTDEASSALVSRLQSLGKQGRHVAAKAISAYDARGHYGPQIVTGAAVLVGGAVALRAGKVPGAFAGGLGGLMAYENVYGLNNYSANSWRSGMPKRDS